MVSLGTGVATFLADGAGVALVGGVGESVLPSVGPGVEPETVLGSGVESEGTVGVPVDGFRDTLLDVVAKKDGTGVSPPVGNHPAASGRSPQAQGDRSDPPRPSDDSRPA